VKEGGEKMSQSRGFAVSASRCTARNQEKDIFIIHSKVTPTVYVLEHVPVSAGDDHLGSTKYRNTMISSSY
jgi:hypothetical protein